MLLAAITEIIGDLLIEQYRAGAQYLQVRGTPPPLQHLQDTANACACQRLPIFDAAVVCPPHVL